MRKAQSQRRVDWAAYKIKKVILIQSVIRKHLVRRKVSPVLKAGRIIVRVLVKLCHRRLQTKLDKARSYYRHVLLTCSFQYFIKHTTDSRRELRLTYHRLVSLRSSRTKRNIFYYFVNNREDKTDKALGDQAVVLWEENLEVFISSNH